MRRVHADGVVARKENQPMNLRPETRVGSECIFGGGGLAEHGTNE